jgi:chromate transporter
MNVGNRKFDAAMQGDRSSLMEIFLVFLRLGLTSFGGPTAHIGYFREAFVEKRKWLTDSEYADLVALCQFLPGPASSQVGFAVGLRRGGWLGGAAAWLGFTLPSALALVIFGLSLLRWGSGGGDSENGSGWLRGLQLTAVVVIAKAVWSMAVSLCPDRLRVTLALAAAAVVLAWPGTLAQVGVILGGGLVGWLLLKKAGQGSVVAESDGIDSGGQKTRLSRMAPMICLVLFAALLFGLPVVAKVSGSREWVVADGFFRTGSLVFGGGHVVLPLLRAEMVEPGLVTEENFLAGYGAAQAVPGPLFTFAAYLGTVIEDSDSPVRMAAICLVAVFAPSWLLIGGVLPLWERLRRIASLRSALAGTNAAVVGLLGAALYRPAWTGAVNEIGDVLFLLGIAAAFLVWRMPVWAVVIVAGFAGGLVLR